MDLEQRLRASLVAPDPGAVFTARVMARVGRGRGQGRTGTILIGTVLAVGAAAAILVWRMTAVEATPAQGVAAQVVDPEPAIAEPIVVAAVEVKQPEATLAPKPAPSKPAPTQDVSPKYSVLVLPLRQQAQNVAGRSEVEALYAAMLDELRKVPGLRLQEQGDSYPGDGQADYVLTITSLATAVSQSGGVVMRATDGSTRCAENGGPEMFCGNGGASITGGLQLTRIPGAQLDIDHGSNGISRFTIAGPSDPASVVWVEMKVESTRSAAALYTLPMRAEGAPEQQRCKNAVGLQSPDCMSPTQLAARQVETWRLQVFPPDPAFQQRVLARLARTSQELAGGVEFHDLLQGLVRGDGSRLDAGTLSALVNFLAGQPASTRVSAWSMLRQVSHPALVAPLVDSLRHDPDRQVRLSALAGLAANYSADPEVRRVFEEIDREDPDPMVRATVRRALYGPAQWHDDVLAALNDAELPYEARLAPLIANVAAGSPQQEFEYSRARQAVLQEPPVLGSLMTLIQEHVRDVDHAQSTASGLSLLGGVEDPAVFDLFLKLAREGSLPIPVTGPVGTWVLNHQNDPRVREIQPSIQPLVPSQLLERMKQVTGPAGDAASGGESPVYGTGSGAIVIQTPLGQ
jgi:hypothetical protein